jgi:hypothetical protein
VKQVSIDKRWSWRRTHLSGSVFFQFMKSGDRALMTIVAARPPK